MLSVVLEGLGLSSLDHQRPVHPLLFLKPRMTVVPIRSGLTNIESVGVGLARSDAVKAQARYAIHVGGKQNAVPMNGRIFAK